MAVDLREEDGPLVGSQGESEPGRPVEGVEHRGLPGAEVEELDPGDGRSATTGEKVDALGGHREVEAVAEAIEDLRLLAPFDGDAPQRRRAARVLRVVEPSPVGGLDGRGPTLPGHLNRRTAAGRDGPDFRAPAARRDEVDATAVP